MTVPTAETFTRPDGLTVTLYLGDCLDVLPTLAPGSVDAVITDPPYGINHSSGFDATWANTIIDGDESTEIRDAAICCLRFLPMAVFGSWKSRRPNDTRAILIWDKGPASGMGDLSFPWKQSFEEIYILGDGWTGRRDEGVIRGHNIVTWETKGRNHPNEKPVSLISALISKLPFSRCIIDPFMGSGTTGVAAVKLGRSFIGIEKEPKYYEIARRRILEALAQPALFQV